MNPVEERENSPERSLLDPWYLENLVCPRDHLRLQQLNNALICPMRHTYSVVDGVPIMLLDDVEQTIGVARASLNRTPTSSNRNEKLAHFHLESLGISEEEKAGVIELALQGDAKVDPAVAYLIAATNSLMYKHLIGKLDSYPIPDLRLPNGHGKTFLDIGCNWGRWGLAAARKNYNAIGVDPSLGAVTAARGVAQSLGLSAKYIVGDARYLPLPSAKFDTVFSYSVLQRFSREDVRITLSEIGRFLKPSGISLIQMPTMFGVRCLYHQIK